MTYFYYKVKVKGQDLGHYLAKLLKRFQFSQNVLTFLSVKRLRQDDCQYVMGDKTTVNYAKHIIMSSLSSFVRIKAGDVSCHKVFIICLVAMDHNYVIDHYVP